MLENVLSFVCQVVVIIPKLTPLIDVLQKLIVTDLVEEYPIFFAA
jgi:hypothetical protein